MRIQGEIDLEHAWRASVQPPRDRSIWQWCDDSLILTARQATAFPGPYRSERTPYVRGIMDAFQDPCVRKITLCKGAQTAGTMTMYGCAAWAICEDPGAMLFVYPTEDNGRSASSSRFMPLVDASPVLAAEKTDDADEYTKLEYRLKRNTINWVGSNSPANLSSRPVRYLFLDEVDKYPGQTDKEADAVSLAIQRAKTFWNRKIFDTSTPTTPEGAITVSYLDGDQRRYFIPCPKCGQKQMLKWSQVKFDPSLPATEAAKGAYYECEVCGAHWSDVEKRAALSGGEWRATAKPKTTGHVSFHLSSLYAPWTTWAQLVERFLRAKKFPSELQDFINSELAEPWVAVDDQIKSTAMAAHEGEYQEGEVFASSAAYADRYVDNHVETLAGVDVQKGYLVVTLRAFADCGDSGGVWHGTLANLDLLERLCEAHSVQAVFIDRRYRTREIDEWALNHSGYIPCEGVKTRLKALCTTEKLDIDEGKSRKVGRRVVTVLRFDPDQVKDILAAQINQDEGANVWLVPKGYASREDYCAQMASERRVNGKWIQIAQRPNHAWDTETLVLLGAIRLQLFGRYDVDAKQEDDHGKS